MAGKKTKKKGGKKGKKGKKATGPDPEVVAAQSRGLLETFRSALEEHPAPKKKPAAGEKSVQLPASGDSAEPSAKKGGESGAQPKSGKKSAKTKPGEGSSGGKGKGGDKDAVVKHFDNQIEEIVDGCLEKAVPVTSICLDDTCTTHMCKVLCITFQQLHFKPLRALCFWSAPVGDYGGKLISEMMRQLPSLTRLHIVDGGLGIEACRALCEAFHHENRFKRTIRELKLCHNNFGLAGLSILVPGLSQSYLTSLSLSYCGLRETCGHELSQIVSKCPLTELNLEGNQLKSEGVLALAAGLPHCQHLSSLNLSMNEFGQTVRRADAAESVSDDNLLVLVVLAKVFASLSKLSDINLKGNEFGSSGGEILASALQTCSHIQRLEVTPRMNKQVFERIHAIVAKRGSKGKKKGGKKSKKKKSKKKK